MDCLYVLAGLLWGEYNNGLSDGVARSFGKELCHGARLSTRWLLTQAATARFGPLLFSHDDGL